MTGKIKVVSDKPLVAGVRSKLMVSFSGAGLRPGARLGIAFDHRGSHSRVPQIIEPDAADYLSLELPKDVIADISMNCMQHYGVKNGQFQIECESDRWMDVIGPEFSLNSWEITTTVVSGEIFPNDELRFLFGYSGPGFLLSSKAYARYPFWARVDIKGDGAWQKVGGDSVVIRPDKPVHTIFYSPSCAFTGESIPVVRRNFDANFNFVNSGKPMTLDANHRGVVRPKIKGLKNRTIEFNPTFIKGEKEGSRKKIWWGDIHAHTSMCDGGCRSLDEYYQWARDAVCLDFSAMSSHDFGIACRGHHEAWNKMQAISNNFNKTKEFVTLLGWETSHIGQPACKAVGHKNVYFREDNVRFFNSSPYGRPGETHVDANDYNEWITLLEKQAAQGKHAIVISHHSIKDSCPGGMGTNWNYFSEKWERLVEIFSLWGSSEAVSTPWAAGSNEGASVLAALRRGFRLGFVSGSDGHNGRPASRLDFRQNVEQSGLTAVYAPSLSRESIFDALWERNAYATTGPRIFLYTEIGGHEMGKEISVEPGNRLEHERCIKVVAAAPRKIDRIEVIRNGVVIYTFQGGSDYIEEEWTDISSLAGWTLTDINENRFVFYYIRVWLVDLHRAWSSPVWFDVIL